MKPHFCSSALSAVVTLIFAGLAGADGGDIHPLKARTGLPPFGYTNSPDPLPNYVAGAKWGTQTKAITTMQKPLAPSESAKHLVVQPGFTSKLWANDPDITKPIALACRRSFTSSQRAAPRRLLSTTSSILALSFVPWRRRP